ncbi:MAG: hypothetical protein PHN20_04700 [Bacteroidales bacterium]|nr:hypothetical protein [Bacteroidales bacterium]
MRKLYTLLVSLCTIGFAGAQTYDWNFSADDFNALGTMETLTTVNNLQIYAEAGKAVVVDANGKSEGGVTYTHRIKMGGTGAFTSDSPKTPLNRVLAFAVNGPVNITIKAMSSSSSTDRVLNVESADGTLIGTVAAPGTPLTATTLPYTGERTSIYIYSPSSGVNIYHIQVSEATGLAPVESAKTIVDRSFYDLTGKKASDTFEALRSGLYIQKTRYNDGSQAVEKVLKTNR